MLSTEDAEEGSSPCPAVSQVLRLSVPCASFCSRGLDKAQGETWPEAAVTSGQEEQRDLTQKKLEGFMESFWEARNLTVCFGGPYKVRRVRQGCREAGRVRSENLA